MAVYRLDYVHAAARVLGPRDCSCIWLILNETHGQYNTTVGCCLEAQVESGCIKKLDSVHGHCDSMTRCHQGLNLKEEKNYSLGNLGPY